MQFKDASSPHSRPFAVCSKTVSIDGFEDVPKSDEHALRQAVSQQPISVAICASELQFYGSGEPPVFANAPDLVCCRRLATTLLLQAFWFHVLMTLSSLSIVPYASIRRGDSNFQAQKRCTLVRNVRVITDVVLTGELLIDWVQAWWTAAASSWTMACWRSAMVSTTTRSRTGWCNGYLLLLSITTICLEQPGVYSVAMRLCCLRHPLWQT